MSKEVEVVHRAQLKKLGYQDYAIDEAVKRFQQNGSYLFAEAYHQERVKKIREATTVANTVIHAAMEVANISKARAHSPLTQLNIKLQILEDHGKQP